MYSRLKVFQKPPLYNLAPAKFSGEAGKPERFSVDIIGRAPKGMCRGEGECQG